MSSTAYAQIQLSYSTSDSGVTVTVTGIEKNPALVSVIKGEYNADLQADKREYVFFKELYENGSVFCKISDDDPSGEYTVITSIDGEIETESLWHMNTKLAADALKKLRECKSAEETAKVIEAEHGVLGIDYDEFKKTQIRYRIGFTGFFPEPINRQMLFAVHISVQLQSLMPPMDREAPKLSSM